MNKIKELLTSKDMRSKTVRNNALMSAVLKVIGLSCSLFIVPVTLGYLDNEVFGIWLTMSSILYWFAFFDIGLGNGMRNYLAEAFARNDFDTARSYISTTFVMLIGLSFIIGLIMIVPVFLLDMNSVFNTTAVSGMELRNVMVVALVFTMALFVVKNIGLIFVAMQKYAVNDFLSVSGTVLALLVIYILTKTTGGSLMNVVLAFTVIPVVVFVLAAIPIFRKYRNLRPTLSSVDKKLGSKIVGKGLGFFFIQITSCLVIYGSSNLFITQFGSPKDVTVYNIAYKFFNLLAIAYTIVISPMWNAYTDAYVKGEMKWIENMFRRAIKIWVLSVLGGMLMLAFCNVFYRLWVGDSVSVPLSVSASVLFYISMFNFNNCVTYLLNGLNKIRVQIITSVVVTAAYLIVVYVFGSKFGIVGVVLSMAFSYAIMAIIHIYQCRLLIGQKAKGIWNK
ncbi:lipopolysaccharide biosynthesis protein [Prevotella sp.]|uniref:lipopolysaccharide biosynthesis protein n=1 Tax=Prevotella sp. TaxID=59823 RepID=UPI003FD84ACB